MIKFLSFGIIVTLLMMTSGLAAFAQPEVIIKHKVNPHSQSPQHTGQAPATGGTASTSPLTYHGGPVINAPTIYLIWYGNWNQTNGSDNPGGQSIIRDWAQSIGGSPHYQLNASYSQSGKVISGNAYYGGETTDSGTKTKLRDADVKTIVNNAINSGRLPYDASGVYFVLTSSNVTLTSGFCTQYCGWHTYSNLSSGKVRYSFVGNAHRCLNACAPQTVSPNGNAGVDAMISVLTHELEEAHTDPDLNAWYDSTGYENADKCAWTFGHSQYQTANGSYANMNLGGRDFLIQRNLFRLGSLDYCMVNSSAN